MFSEFHVRAEVSAIQALDISPIGRARAMLRVAQRVKAAARRLTMLGQSYYKTGDPLRGARFREAAQRLCVVHEDVRAHAYAALGARKKEPLGFDYAPRPEAVPNWEVAAGGAE